MNSDGMNFNDDARKPALSMGNSAKKTAVNALAESYGNACREMAPNFRKKQVSKNTPKMFKARK